MSAIQQMLLGGGSSVPGVTYATWDPSTKGANITLSGGNLTISLDNNYQELVKSTIGKAAGKWYWEVTVTSTKLAIVGIGDSGAEAPLGTGVLHSAGYLMPSGVVYNTDASILYVTTGVQNDVIGFALNATSKTYSMYINGVINVTDSSYTGTTEFAGFGGTGEGGTTTATANFGATPFVYSPPVGFNAGLYI